jgi:hypothetical protein
MYNSKGSGLFMLLRHLPNCLIFVALLAGQAGLFAQESGYKSIHRIQAEEYRDLAVYSAPGTTQPQPLPPQAVSNVTRTVFGFFPYWAPGFSQIRFQDLSHLAVFSVEADANGQLVNLRGWPWSICLPMQARFSYARVSKTRTNPMKPPGFLLPDSNWLD